MRIFTFASFCPLFFRLAMRNRAFLTHPADGTAHNYEPEHKSNINKQT